MMPAEAGGLRSSRPRLLLLLLMFSSTADSQFDPGPQCTGITAELVCGAGKWFGSGGIRQDYKGCAPKTCKEFPSINHGHTKPRGGRVEVGQSITVFCESGYELDQKLNTSSTPRCQADCTFEPNMGCKKIKCQAPAPVANSEVVNVGEFVEFGDEVVIQCNVGFRPSGQDLPSFNEACETSFSRRCLADGSMSNPSTTCVPVQCPAYSPSDRSLTCEDGSCGPLRGAVVATVAPSGVANYLDSATIACNGGYMWDDSSVRTATCGATCQYTPVIAGRCVPLSCPIEGTIAKSDFPQGLQSLPFGSSLTVSCDEGYVSEGACASETVYSCSVFPGIGDSGLPSLDVPPSNCIEAQCNQSVALDNTAALNASGMNQFSAEVALQCNEGHRAIEADLPSNVADCDVPDYTIQARCGTETEPCSWVSDYKCVPVQCDLFSLTLDLDGTGSISESEELAVYGDTFTVECFTGHYISNTSNGSIVPGGQIDTLEVTCGKNCTFPPVFCLPATCGAFEPTGLQTFVNPLDAGMSKVHDEVVEVTCLGDWIPEPTDDNFGTCERTFTVSCVDGVFMGNRDCVLPQCGMGCEHVGCEFRPDRFSVGYNMSAPTVMLLSHGEELEVSCSAGYRASFEEAACDDPTSYVVSCDKMCLVAEGRNCTLLCDEELIAFTGVVPQSCRDVFCDIANSQPENSSVFPPSDYIFFNQTVQLECDDGFRLWSGSGSPPANLTTGTRSQTLRCNGGCDMDQVHCVPLLCPPFQLGANHLLSGYDFGQLHHGETLSVKCMGDLVPGGLLPPDCGQNFTVQCYDGQLIGNKTCQNLIRHDCEDYVDDNGIVTTIDANLSRSVTVTCNTGYVAYNLSNNGSSLPTCGVTEYSSVCDRCEFDIRFACVPLGCGRFIPRMVSTGNLNETVRPDRYMLYNETVNVSCPAGFRIGSDNIADSSWTLSRCLNDCNFASTPFCLPIACETYEVPSNSMATTQDGTAYSAGSLVQLHYNESVVVSCDVGYVLEGTTDAECALTATATCSASGIVLNSGVKCVFRPCGVDCNLGSRYAGRNGNQFGCDNVTMTCPPTAPRMWVKDIACDLHECRQDEFCTPVACDEFMAPTHGVVNFASNDSNPQLIRNFGYTHDVLLTCDMGFAPESEIQFKGISLSDMPINSTSFLSTCSDDGAWNYSEKCLGDTCLFVNFSYSCGYLQPRLLENGLALEQVTPYEDYTFFGESVSISCPEGFRIGSRSLDGPMSVESFCLDDCTFGAVPICTAVSCGTYTLDPNSTATIQAADGRVLNTTYSSYVEAVYNQTIIVTCNTGFILASSDDQACEFEDEIKCLSNAQLDSHVDCIPQPCRVSCAFGTRFCDGAPSCQSADSNSWVDMGGCSVESPSRCEEDRSCSPVQCAAFPVSSNSDISGLASPNVFGDVLSVKCRSGYILRSMVPTIDQALNSSFYTTSDFSNSNFTQYNSTCGDDGNWSNYDMCVADTCVIRNNDYSCAVPQARFVEDMLVLEEVLQGPGYLSSEESVSIRCPDGYRFGNRSSEAGAEMQVSCQSDCTTEAAPLCLAIECSAFTVPESSTAQLRLSNGTLLPSVFTSGDAVTILFGQRLVVSCEVERTVTNSSSDSCVFSGEVTCGATGDLSGSNIQCEMRNCAGKCTEGTRYGGVNGTSDGCDGSRCPSSAPDTFPKIGPCVNQSVSRCFEIEVCLPIACGTYPAPLRGSFTSTPDSSSIFFFNDTLNVSMICNEGFAPDSQIKSKGTTLNSVTTSAVFTASCIDSGSYDRIEECLSSTCYFFNNSFSCGQVLPRAVDNNPDMFETVSKEATYIQRNEFVNITCPEGYRLGSRDQAADTMFMQVCQDDCNFLTVPSCMAISCGNVTVPSSSIAQFRSADGSPRSEQLMSGVNVSLLFGESLVVSCDQNFTVNGQCLQMAELTCQADGSVSESLSCEYKECQINCTAGTRYGGPDGNQNGCNGTVCSPTAPKSYPKGAPCSNQTFSACFEFATCLDIECDAYPAPLNARVLSSTASSYTTYQDVITISCNSGFIRADQVTNTSLVGTSIANITNLTIYTSSCGDSGQWSQVFGCVVPSCMLTEDGNLSCGQYARRFSDDGFRMEEHPFGLPSLPLTSIGGAATVQCPLGYRLGSTDASLPRDFTVPCMSDCAFQSLPSCTAITCGNYQVPGNSSAQLTYSNGTFGGNFTAGQGFELMYGDAVTVTCAEQYTLDGTLTCGFQEEIMCMNSGLLSNEPSCSFQSCAVTCSPGTRSCGGASFCFPTDATSYVDSEGCPAASTSRCSFTDACTPFRCDAYTPPENSTVVFGSATQSVYEDVLRIECDAGYFVESGASDCKNDYEVSCLANGAWTSSEVCVPKYCIVESYTSTVPAFLVDSQAVPLGTSYTKSCGFCDTPSPANVNPVCQSNCQMDIEQTCVPVTCEWDSASQSNAQKPEINSTSCGQTIEVMCATGYRSKAAGCQRWFEPACQEDGQFDLQDEDQCVPITCPPLITVDGNVANTSNTTSTGAFGTTFTARCAVNYGAGGVAGATYLATCDPSDTATQNCSWSHSQTCERISCGAFELPPNAHIVGQAEGLAGDFVTAKCNDGWKINTTDAACQLEIQIECNSMGQFAANFSCVEVTCPAFSTFPVCTQEERERLPTARNDQEVGFGEYVGLYCPGELDEDGNERAENVTCLGDCTLSPHALSCQTTVCAPFVDFNVSSGPPPPNAQDLPVLADGGRVIVECEEGFELVNGFQWPDSEGEPPGTMSVTLWAPAKETASSLC